MLLWWLLLRIATSAAAADTPLAVTVRVRQLVFRVVLRTFIVTTNSAPGRADADDDAATTRSHFRHVQIIARTAQTRCAAAVGDGGAGSTRHVLITDRALTVAATAAADVASDVTGDVNRTAFGEVQLDLKDTQVNSMYLTRKYMRSTQL